MFSVLFLSSRASAFGSVIVVATVGAFVEVFFAVFGYEAFAVVTVSSTFLTHEVHP